MNHPLLKPLGDQAVLAYLPDEGSAIRFAAAVRAANLPWLVDVVSAYASVGVYFDPEQANLSTVRTELSRIKPGTAETVPGPTHVIPCCYEMQLDLARVAEHTNLTPEEVIAAHAGSEYTVYAIGFCPGFPYLGYLPPALTGVPRIPSPRLRVESGSVGLTGRQTGLYPLARPGGWNLIGLTPLQLVSVEDGYFPLRPGDRVRFQRIDEAEYKRLKGERLRSA
ncbi:MAG TPA: allophanate hydrolase subunit 1 [Gemmataceae bacterium]|nr:allophanate hydrolase subunit 1 [Gemmataceae bacterium]